MFFNIRKSILVIVISLIIYGIGIGAYVATAQTPSSAIPLTIDGIECNANEQFLFHIHAHLSIFVNCQLMYIPPQIGIIPEKCIYNVGPIYVESPIKRDFTLGQFFELWKKKLNNPIIFDKLFNSKDNMPEMYINGPLNTSFQKDCDLID
jgi:hypothetical protein